MFSSNSIDKKTRENIFLKRMQSVHVSVGITFSLFMYISLYFGLWAIYLPYIQTWEKPSRHISTIDSTKIDYSSMIDPVISDPDFPQDNIIIKLPGLMNDPALSITHQFVEDRVFDPSTKQLINAETSEQSQLASFLNHMHYGRPFGIVGRILFGLVAVGVLFLAIGGLIQLYKIKYSNSAKNKQSFFSKYHRKILLWVFPVFLLITLTGAFFNVGLLSSPLMIKMLTSGTQADVEATVGPTLFPQPNPIKKLNQEVTMLPINELVKKAKKIDNRITFQEIRLVNWKDKSAQFEIKGYNPYMPFLNGFLNKPSITLSGVDGSFIKKQDVLDRPYSVHVFESTMFLHVLFGVDLFTRTIVALLMLGATFAIAFGVYLWLGKKEKTFEKNNIPFYHWMSKVSMSVMIGVIPATGLLFCLQYLLPFDMENRVFWQKSVFFNFWLATLTWSFYRINSYKASREFLFLGGVFFLSAPIFHFANVDYFLLDVINIPEIIGVDIGLCIFGAILLTTSYKLPKDGDKLKQLFKKSKDKNEKA